MYIARDGFLKVDEAGGKSGRGKKNQELTLRSQSSTEVHRGKIQNIIKEKGAP
jgi:hypothetical protein